jgi:hypothetical protein
LDLGRFDGNATDPDDAFDDDIGYHGANGDFTEGSSRVVAVRQELLDRFLENLGEGYNHDLG